jgi:hypothetical protein
MTGEVESRFKFPPNFGLKTSWDNLLILLTYKIKCQRVNVRVTRLGDFSTVGLLLEAHCDFTKRSSCPKEMMTFLATFCWSNFLHFYPVIGTLRFQKWCRCFGLPKWALM